MTFKRLACAAAVLLSLSTAHADVLMTNFENPFSIGPLPGGLDARTPGNANQWYVPDNAATFGEVRAGVGRGGSNGLVVGNRGNGNDGVIDNVKSGMLAQAAGETSSGAPNRMFESSFWFRTASTVADANFAFKTETWGTDRTTWLGFFANGSGGLEAEYSGMDTAGNFTSVIVNNTLSWGEWYQVVTKVLFADGGPANDLVSVDILNAGGTNIGSVSGQQTWEEGQRQFGYNGGMQVAANAIGFQARFSTRGDTVIIDDVSWASSAIPEPGSLALIGLAGLAAFAAGRRKAR